MPIKDPVKRAAYEKKRNATPARRKARSMNVQARRIMEKAVGASRIKGKDIDHKRPITRGGTNARSNLRTMSPARNRARRSR